MLNSITTLFKQLLDGNDLGGSEVNHNPNLAIASLLCEVAAADQQISPQEVQAKVHLLQGLVDVSEQEATSLIEQATQEVKHSVSLYDYTSKLRALSQETRFELIKAMWEVAFSDGEIDPIEDAVIRKSAELLYVDHSEFIRAKLAVIERNN